MNPSLNLRLIGKQPHVLSIVSSVACVEHCSYGTTSWHFLMSEAKSMNESVTVTSFKTFRLYSNSPNCENGSSEDWLLTINIIN